MSDIRYIEHGEKNMPILCTLPLNEENLRKVRGHKIWLDLSAPTIEELMLIGSHYKIHPTTIEDLKNTNTRIKVEEFNTYLLIIIYEIFETSSGITQKEIDIVLSKNYIITTNIPKSPVTNDKNFEKKIVKLLNNGTDYLAYYLIDGIISSYEPLIEKIGEQIFDLQGAISERTDRKVLTNIISTKRDIMFLRKIVWPEKDKISFIVRTKHKQISKPSLPYFRDVYDKVTRINEINEGHRDAIKDVYDSYMSYISFNTNQIIKILSIISTIFIPLTFITGFFGMNFEFLPLLHSREGIWGLSIFMGLTMTTMLYVFKRQKWI